MALIIEETGRYLNIKTESSLEPGFSNLVLRDYKDKQTRDTEKQYEGFRDFLLSSLPWVADHFYSQLMEEIQRAGCSIGEDSTEEEVLFFLEQHISVREKHEKNAIVLDEITAIQDVMGRLATSMTLVPTNVFEHLKAHLLHFDICTINDFAEAIVGSSPHFDEMGLGFTDRCFLSVEAAYQYIKEVKLISANVFDDI